MSIITIMRKSLRLIQTRFGTDMLIAAVISISKEPLCLTGIAKRCDLDPQGVKYHLPILIQKGLIIPLDDEGKHKFTAQPLFAPEHLKDIEDRFCDMIDIVAPKTDCTFADEPEDTLRHIMILLSIVFTQK